MKDSILKTYELGQSIWCDYISRDLLNSGGLKSMIERGVKGVTSNPAIFKKAITEGDDYDTAILEFSLKGLSPKDIYEQIALEDVRRASDIMRTVYDDTDGNDGFVSLEVSPDLAHDVDGTVEEALRLNEYLNRPNVMIKIPATDEGYEAIERATSAGININATLIFSLEHYEKVAEAYIRGLEDIIRSGGDVSSIRSVASVFVSRIDSAVDAQLSDLMKPLLGGKVAIDNARLIYSRWAEIFSGPRWEELSSKGAVPQRVLWASTGTKNKDYRDTLYVEELIGADTVNTVPPATMDNFLDHGEVEERLGLDLDGARKRMNLLGETDVDLIKVCDFLREAGVQSFVDAFNSLISSVAEKAKN